MNLDLEVAGKEIESIEVQLSYRIIELFSGHLYSSPTKAVEELVVNSYDAFATKCMVSVPEGMDGQVWVWDNGDSMDLDGLRELWLVAESRKRDSEREKAAAARGRLPIGKFGIGKLASYVLGSRISHICRRNDKYLAVTMDYTRIAREDESKKLFLTVRELTKAEVELALPFVIDTEYNGSKIDLFAGGAKSWTIVVVDRLKQQLPRGRLRWILSTAMPLVPDFRLFLNGEEVKSSKEKIRRLQTWQIGKDDATAEKMGLAASHYSEKEAPDDYSVMLEPYGVISGILELYEEPLDVGKSTDIGYSYGFFIRVRNRLVNMQDNLFGITTLPHGVGFNRFRAVVHADFLDKFLTADREDTAIDAKRALANYLANKFNEVRNYYERILEKTLKQETLEDHLKGVPGTLLKYPLQQAIEKITSKDLSAYTIRLLPGKPSVPTIERIETRTSDAGGPLATLEGGAAVINETHPFYRSFADYPGIRKLAIAEILLEAYVLAAGVEPEKSREIMTRRDQLLRVLASKFPEAANEVSELIRQSVTSQDDLETYSVDGFQVLGFDAVHLGGKGKPDGLAIAHLGQVEGRKYVVTIDAKSTLSDAVQSGNLGLATVARHRKEYNADYSVVIAPDYQIAGGDASKAVKEARDQKVCLLRANDFADLVASSSVRPLPLNRLRTLFEKNSPDEAKSWVDTLNEEKLTAPPIKTILEAIWRMQTKEQKDAPNIAAIRYEEPALKDKYSSDEIKEWLLSLSRLQPELIVITGERIQLNQTPDHIIRQCTMALNNISKGISTESLLEGLELK